MAPAWKNTMNYNRGDVVLVNYSNSDGKTYKKRPALVIQANGLQTGIPQVVMAAITSNLYWTGATRVLFRSNSKNGRSMGLNKDSLVMADNLSTVLEREIHTVIGYCPAMQLWMQLCVLHQACSNEGMAMICPNCQSENRADATFCLECGAPLDEETLAAAPAPPKPIATSASALDLTRLLKPLRWSWSVRLVVLLGLIALIVNWMGSTTQQSYSDIYQAAKQAADEHRWHSAAAMFKKLADVSYYDAAAQYAQVETQVKSFDDLYGKGSYAENHNQDVLAAYYYDQANQIEPGEYAVDVTLARLRRTNGRILYRIATGSRAGLYVAEADGGVVLKIPESNADSVVLAVSPDGRLVVFSNRVNGSVQLYIKDTQPPYTTVAIEPPHVLGAGRYPEQNVSVAMFNDGADLLVLDGGQFTNSNNDPGNPSSALAYSYNLNNHGSNYIGLVDAIAYPDYYDKLLYYTDAVGDLHSYDAPSDKASFALTPNEHIYYLQELRTNQLLYATYASITTTLYTVNIGQWSQPRKLIEVASSERPYGTVAPQLLVSPEADRLYLWYFSKAKGVESYLLDLGGSGAAKVLRYAVLPVTVRPNMVVAFSDSGRGLLLNVLASPPTTPAPPGDTLSVLGESNFDYFFTYPYIQNDSSRIIEHGGFLDEATIFYIANRNGATRESNMGDIIVAAVSNPTQPVTLAQVNTDTIGNWQPIILMPDQHTIMYCGTPDNGKSQGIYINTSDGKQPFKIAGMDQAVAFWHLGGQ